MGLQMAAIAQRYMKMMQKGTAPKAISSSCALIRQRKLRSRR